MKILVFLHGTTIMHKNAVGHTREEIVKQVKEKEKSVYDYKSYVPVGSAVKKLQHWKNDGAEILLWISGWSSPFPPKRWTIQRHCRKDNA